MEEDLVARSTRASRRLRGAMADPAPWQPFPEPPPVTGEDGKMLPWVWQNTVHRERRRDARGRRDDDDDGRGSRGDDDDRGGSGCARRSGCDARR